MDQWSGAPRAGTAEAPVGDGVAIGAGDAETAAAGGPDDDLVGAVPAHAETTTAAAHDAVNHRFRSIVGHALAGQPGPRV